MGGLPDVNTENPDFQYYYIRYVSDLVNLGARGFRLRYSQAHRPSIDPVA